MIRFDLFNGDCLQVMDKLISKGVKVDMILTDPPYGKNYQSNFKKEKFKKIINDDKQQIDFIKKAYQLLNNNSAFYCFCSWDNYDLIFNEIKKYFSIKNCLVWYKKGGGLGDLKGSYIPNHEFIIFATKGRHILNGKRHNDVLEFSKGNTSEYKHPTQKPIELLEFLINQSTNEGDLVLDCYGGSGSTGVACKNLNRSFIGIEIDSYYYEIMKKRIEEGK